VCFGRKVTSVKMEAALCSETLVTPYEITRHHILDDSHLDDKHPCCISHVSRKGQPPKVKTGSQSLIFVYRVIDIYVYVLNWYMPFVVQKYCRHK
jgi:hypothetical protein